MPIGAGFLGTLFLTILYFGIVSGAESPQHAVELFWEDRWIFFPIFMAIPVIFAEFIAVTELFILLSRNVNGTLKQLNRIAGIIIGIYFTGVFIYLLINAVIPLTVSGGWRGIADVIAVSFYLLGIIPLAGMALMGLGIIGKYADEQGKLKLHATLVAIFLVVAHIAMIFGMLNPELLI